MGDVESEYVQGYLAGYRGELRLGSSEEYVTGYEEGARAE